MKASVMLALLAVALVLEDQGVSYEGGEGPGKGKHAVFVTGDEQYRSEEGMPMLARILATRHGFRCTVLFSTDKLTGRIDPQTRDNIPGLEALDHADLLVLFTRFRQLPDDQMKHIVDYVESGRPVVALRTATHAFAYPADSLSPYRRYSWDSLERGFEGGFGRRVLGETWVAEHGAQGSQSTRGTIAESAKGHTIVRGCEDIWGPTAVYAARLPVPDATPLVLGQVLEGMKPTDRPVASGKNSPMMPVAWIRTYTGAQGKTSRVFVTTMGSSEDLLSEGLRRLLVNACYWAVGLEEKIPLRANVGIVGTYSPTPSRFGGIKKDAKPTAAGGPRPLLHVPAGPPPPSRMAGSSFRLDEPGMELVWIPSGTFLMGSLDGEQDERPLTTVKISRGFWMGKHEVTQGQWQQLMGGNPSGFRESGPSSPVENVTWIEAAEFCRRLSERARAEGRLPPGYEFRLPTEAEWEYACRAGAPGLPSTSAALEDVAWYDGNSQASTHPVGQKKPNAWGLYDMLGNVWEWCWNWYDAYPGGEVVDPAGPEEGMVRVVRGGSWEKPASKARPTARGEHPPDGRGGNRRGFRVALAPGMNP
jgi:formylglycine-generating enzyme required for sulfatase activity